MKRLLILFIVVILISSLSTSTMATVSNPSFTIRVVATPETMNGRGTLTIDWRITANESGILLRGSSGLRLAYDNTVLQLIRYSGIGEGYTLTEALSGVSAAANVGVYEDAIMSVRACRSSDSSIGYLTIEIGHPEYTHECKYNIEETLTSIRFAFHDGKSVTDLTGSSIRLMTLAEMDSLQQSKAVNIFTVTADSNVEYVFRSRAVADSLNEPEFVGVGSDSSTIPPDTDEPTYPPEGQKPPAKVTVIAKPSESVDGKSTKSVVAFTDIDTVPAWAKDAVEFVAARDLVVGLTDNLFKPTEKVTRGEFTATLMRAYGVELDSSATDNFDDVDGNAVYAQYLATAKKHGIAAGVGNNKFSPEQLITREEMFTLLHRILLKIGEAPIKIENGKSLSDFTDSGEVSAWASDSLEALLQAGMVDGTGNNEISPKLLSDRATMAQMIYNLLTR